MCFEPLGSSSSSYMNECVQEILSYCLIGKMDECGVTCEAVMHLISFVEVLYFSGVVGAELIKQFPAQSFFS